MCAPAIQYVKALSISPRIVGRLIAVASRTAGAERGSPEVRRVCLEVCAPLLIEV